VKKKKRKKRSKKSYSGEDKYDHTGVDNFFKKYGVLIVIGFGVASFALDPGFWKDTGKRILYALPAVGWLAFYSILSADKEEGESFNLVGLGFIVIILVVAIFS